MNATEQKIKLAREKSIEWIEYLAAKSDKDLVSRLGINHLQFAIAQKEKKEDVGNYCILWNASLLKPAFSKRKTTLKLYRVKLN